MKTIVFSTSQTANSTLDILRADGIYPQFNVAGILDDDPKKQGQQYYGLPVIGTFRDVERLVHCGEATHFIIGLAAVKHVLIKAALFRFSCKLGLQPVDIVSSRAYVAKSSRLEAGHCVTQMAVVSTDCVIGPNFSMGAGAKVMEKCAIQENVLLLSNVLLGGLCTIEKNVYIGPGAIIGSEVKVGANSIIGAGSVVLKDVPPHSFVRGNPARCVPMPLNTFYLSPPGWMLDGRPDS